ncbi:MAG: hypothetical protein ACK5AZ_26875 [Bryobacteraceae bacterium]
MVRLGRWKLLIALLPLSAVPLVTASLSHYASAKQKIEMIESERAPRGSKVTLSDREVNAFIATELNSAVPEGIRKPHLQLGNGKASGSALIHFLKLKQEQGEDPGWLMSKLLDGERPVTVTARLKSAKGVATVEVESVEVSGIQMSGPGLDFLIRNFLLPRYPTAKIGEPFVIGHNIERLEIRPSAVDVIIQP